MCSASDADVMLMSGICCCRPWRCRGRPHWAGRPASMQGRQTALASCKEAVESAETCHRELVNVFKMNT